MVVGRNWEVAAGSPLDSSSIGRCIKKVAIWGRTSHDQMPFDCGNCDFGLIRLFRASMRVPCAIAYRAYRFPSANVHDGNGKSCSWKGAEEC